MANSTLILKPGKEKALLRGHPWVFSGAVAREDTSCRAGETVVIRASDGRFLAWGAYSPASQIRSRIWSFSQTERIDEGFFAGRIQQALRARQRMAIQSDAMRLVHAEADGIPGLIVDRYDDTLVAQFLSAGVECHKELIAAELLAGTGARSLYERSDAEVRLLEGLAPRVGLIAGCAPRVPLEIKENGVSYGVDVTAGQKTGFYLDQRENRALLREWVFGDVLNCFCYTGAFSICALKGGAQSVTSIDSSADAVLLAQANARRNGLESEHASWICADVFRALRGFRDAARQFDVVILDPPKFAPTTAHVEKAARAYKDINLLGFKLLRPGGLLLTFSCSGGVGPELFQRIVAGAAADAQVDATIVARLSAGADHPVHLAFPEGEYLKGLALRTTTRLPASRADVLKS